MANKDILEELDVSEDVLLDQVRQEHNRGLLFVNNFNG